jgi:hypothetical protein
MAKTLLKPLTPVTKKRAVGPLRRPNSDLRRPRTPYWNRG